MIRLDLVGKSNGATVHEYTERDVILYHLGIGARAEDLDFVYEGVNGGLKVCPTFAVVPMLEPLMKLLPQFNVPLRNILHGEQVIFPEAGHPPSGDISHHGPCVCRLRQGKGGDPRDGDGNDRPGREPVVHDAGLALLQGDGRVRGRSGSPGTPREIPEGRPPDFEIAQKTDESQAVLYRLSGDLNPLHIDPLAATFAGFPRPLLHGLCTFGFVGRAVLAGICRNETARLKEFGVRFSAPVFPGDTITTRGWDMGGGVWHLCAATERGEVLSNAYARVEEE